LAELDFISYLRSHDYGAPETVLSHRGEELVKVRTPWGMYFASVFKRVPGIPLNKTNLSDDILFCHGKALGKLHLLSSRFKPGKMQRWSYSNVLDWIENVLRNLPEQLAALSETKLLRDYFASIPQSPLYFGLVHYDFECDNVFYDNKCGICHAIDFDDAMYHWFTMDIEQALDSLQDDIPSEIFDHKKQCFISGYLTEYGLPDDFETILPACRRFANLYGYVRSLRSVSDKWDHEPDWLTSLREKLKAGMEKSSVSFGERL
jgi:Ser/Thr protein kinase RdoA (MazF antagonist)